MVEKKWSGRESGEEMEWKRNVCVCDLKHDDVVTDLNQISIVVAGLVYLKIQIFMNRKSSKIGFHRLDS